MRSNYAMARTGRGYMVGIGAEPKFDAIAAFFSIKAKFAKERGVKVDSKSPSKGVPRTTWGDVARFAGEFQEQVLDKLDPDARSDAMEVELENAKKAWQDASPTAKMMKEGLNPASPLEWLRGLAERKDKEYPYNEELWRAGTRLMIAMNVASAGMVPGRWEWAWESIKEASKEAAEKVPGFVFKTWMALAIGAGAVFMVMMSRGGKTTVVMGQ